MGYFSNYFKDFTQQLFFEPIYDEISEPLKEYSVEYDNSLRQTPTSDSLLGVKMNGKWGWVDSNNCFVLLPLYDSGFVTCYNGIILLQKDGKWGGIYRNNGAIAFSFKYDRLGHAYNETYVAHNSNNRCALVKPGDRMLTGYNYIGFSIYNHGSITEYVKTGFWGVSRGNIDLNTGREL